MASVTSLPELITGISSVSIVNAPDLAAGDIMGSCVFNLLILSFLDARIKQPLFSLVKSSHIVAAIFSIIWMHMVITKMMSKRARDLRGKFDRMPVIKAAPVKWEKELVS